MSCLSQRVRWVLGDDDDDDVYLSGFPSGDEELKEPEERGGRGAGL